MEWPSYEAWHQTNALPLSVARATPLIPFEEQPRILTNNAHKTGRWLCCLHRQSIALRTPFRGAVKKEQNSSPTFPGRCWDSFKFHWNLRKWWICTFMRCKNQHTIMNHENTHSKWFINLSSFYINRMVNIIHTFESYWSIDSVILIVYWWSNEN